MHCVHVQSLLRHGGEGHREAHGHMMAYDTLSKATLAKLYDEKRSDKTSTTSHSHSADALGASRSHTPLEEALEVHERTVVLNVNAGWKVPPTNVHKNRSQVQGDANLTEALHSRKHPTVMLHFYSDNGHECLSAN